MKTPAILALAAISLSACATAGPAPLVERGYEPGELAVAAIDRGDWAQAERLLNQRHGAAPGDPARLINLGRVYMATGRPGQALSAWRLALASERHFMVETMGGRQVSTRLLAEQALARHERDLLSAAR